MDLHRDSRIDHQELLFLQTLARQYPTIAKASTEIINLQSILNLPKGTEHFLTDIHGEYEQFHHVLKNGSGSIRTKIDDEFGNTLSLKDKKSLATLIYYPKEKLELIKKDKTDPDELQDWYKITLHRMVQITKRAASKYTRSKVRKALPEDFSYVIEELITEKDEVQNKEAYYNEIIHTIIRIGCADEFIYALSSLIKRLIVDHLHIIGDLYDRGPGPHNIMDLLCRYHSVDIQWGNHDVSWMGAAAGQGALIANVIRIASRYGNLNSLEEGYGINLIPLATFAMETYKDHDCSLFAMKGGGSSDQVLDLGDASLNRKMHKAIAIIQFKLEEQLIKKHPEFEMGDRDILSHINFDKGTVVIDGKEYPLLDTDFPTIDPKDPAKLTHEEEQVMERLKNSFVHSEKLQRHVRFLYSKGSIYKVYNGNLLYHGCVPMDKDGKFQSMKIGDTEYSGKALFDILDKWARRGYFCKDEEKDYGLDILWYLWTGPKSPVYGKARMTTFERYFIADKETHKEEKNAYYTLYNNPEIVDGILKEFGLDGDFCHIVNGHVPVEQKKGESPVKCGGKLLVIDGGFSKAYQKTTGIAGYTLVYNSHGMRLVAHEPFESAEAAIRNETDIYSDSVAVEISKHRMNVADTDAGVEIKNTIAQLEELLRAYRTGLIFERA